jgi:hypothetical protein
MHPTTDGTGSRHVVVHEDAPPPEYVDGVGGAHILGGGAPDETRTASGTRGIHVAEHHAVRVLAGGRQHAVPEGSQVRNLLAGDESTHDVGAFEQTRQRPSVRLTSSGGGDSRRRGPNPPAGAVRRTAAGGRQPPWPPRPESDARHRGGSTCFLGPCIRVAERLRLPRQLGKLLDAQTVLGRRA